MGINIYKREKTTLYKWRGSKDSIISTTVITELGADPVNGWGAVKFLLYSGVNGIRNIDRMFSKITDFKEKLDWYDKREQISESSQDIAYNDFPLYPGTELVLDPSWINKLVAASMSPNAEIIDANITEGFLPTVLRNLLNDPKYITTYDDNTDVTQLMPRAKVWLWSRTLYSQTSEYSLIDLSLYIENLNTSVSSGNGSWNITITSAGTEFLEKRGKWVVDGLTESTTGTMAINKNAGQRKHLFFNITIQKNDLIFIQFEPLKSEKFSEKEETGFISNLDLPNKTYDMIGIVGDVSFSTIPSSGDVQTKLNGGDLMKVLMEDSFYYFPEQFGIKELFWNGLDDRGFERISNKLVGFTAGQYRTLGALARFSINGLSQLSIVPEKLFSQYLSRRTEYTDPIDGKDKLARGIYQIIKIVIDQTIMNRAVVDSSLGTKSGSIYSFLNNSVVPPFVELITDTYYDQFYITYRQAPWNYKGYSELAKECEKNLIIYNKNVISEAISWNTDDIYSWYRLMPKAVLTGMSDETIWSIFKAIRFPEYSQVFGEKVLTLSSNYLNYTEDQTDPNQLAQALFDLKFMVDCYSYMPFTRKGTITIRGDRRYKKGTICYYQPTDEYFIIDGVSQSYRVGTSGTDRLTTLKVSRGLVKKYLSWYWWIIETEIIDNGKNRGSLAWMQSIAGNWKVNWPIFEFFLERRQFAKNQELDNSVLQELISGSLQKGIKSNQAMWLDSQVARTPLIKFVSPLEFNSDNNQPQEQLPEESEPTIGFSGFNFGTVEEVPIIKD